MRQRPAPATAGTPAAKPVSAAASASATRATPAPSKATAPKAAAKATASSAPARASVRSDITTALAELAALSAVTPHPGCDRGLFGSGSGPGVRDEVIAGQSTGSGPYTGSSLSRDDIQIDHVAALGNARAAGAYAWTSTRREAFADDENELLAVSAHANESKGDDDVTATPAASVPAQATAPAAGQGTGNYHACNGHPCSWVEDNTGWGHSFQTDTGNKWDRDGDGLACES